MAAPSRSNFRERHPALLVYERCYYYSELVGYEPRSLQPFRVIHPARRFRFDNRSKVCSRARATAAPNLSYSRVTNGPSATATLLTENETSLRTGYDSPSIHGSGDRRSTRRRAKIFNTWASSSERSSFAMPYKRLERRDACASLATNFVLDNPGFASTRSVRRSKKRTIATRNAPIF